MTATKPLEPNCDGSIWCPVEGHLQTYAKSATARTLSHIPLTQGQRRQLRERWKAERPMPTTPQGDQTP